MTAEQFLNYTKLKHQKQEAEDKGTETLISRGKDPKPTTEILIKFDRRRQADHL